MKFDRHYYVPLINIGKNGFKTSGTDNWVRIDKSTIFELDYNPTTETYSYICYKNDSTEITGYAPTMGQEIILDSDNEVYTFMLEYCRAFPTGSECNIPICLVYPTSTGAITDGDLFSDAIVQPDNLNSVDGKLSFTINLNGAPTMATVSISPTQGTPTSVTVSVKLPE